MIELPRLCGTRASAERIFASPAEHTLIVDAQAVVSAAQGFMDEACKQLIAARIDRVTFLGASEAMRQNFLRAHQLRRAKFSVEFR